MLRWILMACALGSGLALSFSGCVSKKDRASDPVDQSSPKEGPKEDEAKVVYATPDDWDQFLTFKDIYRHDEVEKIINSKTHSVKKNPNIYMIIVDTLRGDYVQHMPFLSKFRENSLSFSKSLAGATSTHHSHFQLFFGDISTKREPTLWSGRKGSPYLKVLRKAGYKVSFLSARWPCNLPKVLSEFDDDRFMDFTFDGNQMLDLCIYGISTYLNRTKNKTGNIIDFDAEVVKIFQEHTKFSENGNLVLITIDSPHDPYSWFEKSNYSDLLKSPALNATGTAYVAPKDDENKIAIENSYYNSVIAADDHIEKIVNTIESRDPKSLIVVLSDHGERMFEHLTNLNANPSALGVLHSRLQRQIQANGHGNLGLKQVTDNVMIFRFPEKELNKPSSSKQVYDISAVFPTIFKYLEYSNYDDLMKYTVADSVFDNREQCHVLATPNGADLPQYVTMQNATHKLWVKLLHHDWVNKEKAKLWRHAKFNVFRVTNLEDEDVLTDILTDEKSRFKFMVENFQGCLAKMLDPKPM